MTDRGKSALIQEPHKLTIGPSSLIWDRSKKELIIQVNEISSLPLISKAQRNNHAQAFWHNKC